MSRAFCISTSNGDRYYIHNNGDIERTDMSFTPSGQWRFVALAVTGPGFAFGKRANVTLSDLASGDVPTVYKNGSPRFTVIDYDHGTHRLWASRGITSVYKI
jgi:hypothetical protein